MQTIWVRSRCSPTSTWADDLSGILPTQDQSTRGFTGQEQLADVGLVHMNGRVYDPLLGRFISADPIVQDPFNAQSLNRYSYVYDNPLAYTDPSGHCFLGLCHAGKAIANFLTGGLSGGLRNATMLSVSPLPYPLQFIPPVNNAVNNFVRDNQWAQTFLTISAGIAGAAVMPFCGCGAAIVAAEATYIAGVNGGSLSAMLEAGAIAGGEAEAFNAVGYLTQGQGVGNYFLNVAGHAAVGCAFTAAGGGDCGAGALSAGIGALAAPGISQLFPNRTGG